MNLILTSALFLRQLSFDFLFLMQCQNLREKTSAVDQLDTPSVTTKWHRPGGRDNDGAPTGTNAASTWHRPGGCDCASYSTQRLREQVSDCFMWNKANATAAVYRVIRPAPIPKAFTPKATRARDVFLSKPCQLVCVAHNQRTPN